MTPWQLAKDTEHSQQRALFAWANCVALYGWQGASIPATYSQKSREDMYQLSPVHEMSLLFAIHNQGHGDRIRGAQAKAEGVKAGVPDLMLPVKRLGYAGLFIEMKKLTKGVVSENQIKWCAALTNEGYGFVVCKGWIIAANAIASYMGSGVRLND